MPNFNHVILIGHLTRDPELSYTQSNTPMVKCGIAVDSGWGDNKKPCFVDFTIFGKRAESFNQHMEKGKCARVMGELELQQWESNGQKRSKLALIVNDWAFGDSKGGGERKAEPARSTSRDDAPLDYTAVDDIPF